MTRRNIIWLTSMLTASAVIVGACSPWWGMHSPRLSGYYGAAFASEELGNDSIAHIMEMTAKTAPVDVPESHEAVLKLARVVSRHRDWLKRHVPVDKNFFEIPLKDLAARFDGAAYVSIAIRGWDTVTGRVCLILAGSSLVLLGARQWTSTSAVSDLASSITASAIGGAVAALLINWLAAAPTQDVLSTERTFSQGNLAGFWIAFAASIGMAIAGVLDLVIVLAERRRRTVDLGTTSPAAP